jgi:hypothetical protein
MSTTDFRPEGLTYGDKDEVNKIIQNTIKNYTGHDITYDDIVWDDNGRPDIDKTMKEAGIGSTFFNWLVKLIIMIIEQLIINWVLEKKNKKKDDPDNKDK